MSPFLRQALLVAAIAITAGAAGFWVARGLPAGRAPATPPPAVQAGAEGQPAPEVNLPDADGRPHRLADWRGRWLLVNFWATWCAPCMHEIPAFIATQSRYGAAGLQVLGIAMDDPDAVRALMRQKGFNYPSLVGDEAVQGVMEQFGNTLGALPFTVLIDPAGIIRAMELGGVDQARLDALVQRFLPP